MFLINTIEAMHFLAEQVNQVHVALMNKVGVSVSSIGFMVLQCMSFGDGFHYFHFQNKYRSQ